MKVVSHLRAHISAALVAILREVSRKDGHKCERIIYIMNITKFVM
jgi:hypothetical protein